MMRRALLIGLFLSACDDGGLGDLLEGTDEGVDGRIADAATRDAGADADVADMTPLPLPDPEDWPRFAFPILESDRALLRLELILGVDHDPVVRDGVLCMAHDGRNFPFCYDEHGGTDYLLTGGFDAMDRGSAVVVAAAGGVVTHVEDGHYDRCHGTIDGGIDCDGHPMFANLVVLRHANGYESRYLHLKSGSLLVEVGERVECGQPLARVGSSGISAQPHLHFSVFGPRGARIDPYAGEFSQPESYWAHPPTAEQRLPGPACAPAWTRAPED